MILSPTEFVELEIASHQVTVFAKSFCPYCKATKELFAQLNIPIQVHNLDTMEGGADIHAALLELTGQKSVPNVFINGQHFGGNDKIQAAHQSGELAEILQGGEYDGGDGDYVI